MINILDPQVIVLGGGLSNVSQLYDELPAAIRPYIFSESCRTRIVPARYGRRQWRGVARRGYRVCTPRRRETACGGR